MLTGNSTTLLDRNIITIPNMCNMLLMPVLLCLMLVSITAQAAGEILPFTFQPNTKAIAEQVNQNFEALESAAVANETAINQKYDKSEADARFQQVEDEIDGKADSIQLEDLQAQLDQKPGMIASLGYQKTPTVRGVTISNVKINGGSIVSPVKPGSTIEVSMDYHIVDTGCPGCIDEIEIGFSHQSPAGCVYVGVPGAAGVSGSGTINLTAPAEPGIYYIGVDRAQAFSCPAGWWNGAPSSFDRYIAVITVQ